MVKLHHPGAAKPGLQPREGTQESSSPAASSPTAAPREDLDVEVKDIEEMTARCRGGRLARRAAARAGVTRGARLERVTSDHSGHGRPHRRRAAPHRIFRENRHTFSKTIRDEKERYIFERRLLPPDGEAPLTLQEIGDRFKLTRGGRARSGRS